MDTIRENVMMNKAEIGDLIEISNAGSYGYSLAPLLFANHAAPKQYMIDMKMLEKQMIPLSIL